MLIVSGVLGLALLLAGYPLFRVLVVLLGALVGFTYGPEILALLMQDTPPAVLAWLAAGVAALLLALVSWQLFWLAVVLYGVYAGYGIGMALIDNVWIAMGAGVVVALLALALGRLGLIVATALVGAWLLVNVGLLVFGLDHPLPVGDPQAAPWAWGAVVVLGLLGTLVQGRLWRDARRQRY